jgi:hypothetical protein
MLDFLDDVLNTGEGISLYEGRSQRRGWAAEDRFTLSGEHSSHVEHADSTPYNLAPLSGVRTHRTYI